MLIITILLLIGVSTWIWGHEIDELEEMGRYKSLLDDAFNKLKYSIKRRLLINKLPNVLNVLSNDQIDRIEKIIAEVEK